MVAVLIYDLVDFEERSTIAPLVVRVGNVIV